MKFDYNVLEKAGIKLPTGALECTMMQSVYIDENHKPVGHELDEVLTKYLGEKKKKIEKKAMKAFGWESAPTHYMAEYAIQDVQHLPQLREKLLSKTEAKHVKLWENVDRRFMLLLAEIERRGLPINRTLCESLDQKCDIRLDEIQQELGFDPAKPTQLHPKLFADPPLGLGLKVPSRTPKTGVPQVSLSWLAGQGHPVCALIHEYRKTAKQRSSYFSSYLRLTTRDDPILYPTFKQHGTETGRLSCEKPNLQQIPREEWKDAYVKKLFLPTTGRQLWEVDFRTIEYRLAAVYAQSRILLELFEAEGDFHQLVADDVSAQAGVSIGRQQAKTINYLMSFGGGIEVLQKQLGVSYSIAAKIHAGYKKAYWEIFARADDAQAVAEQYGQIDMWSGRTRHFQYPSEYRSAFNSIIQGGAFEIVKRSMLKAHDAGACIVNQVHDSIWLDVDSEADTIEIQNIMEGWTKAAFGLSFRMDRKRLN